MSVEAMAIALHHSRARGTAKVILIGIANHDGDGGAWPSVAKLMAYANADRRTVQRAIDELERLGEVVRVIQSGGTESTHASSDWHRPNLYHFKLMCPMDCDRSRNHKTTRTWTPEFDVDAKTPPGPKSAKTPPGGVQKRRPNLNNNSLTPESEKPYVPERAREREESDGSAAPRQVATAPVAAAGRSESAGSAAPRQVATAPVAAAGRSESAGYAAARSGYALAAAPACSAKPERYRDRSHHFEESGYCLFCQVHEADTANPTTGEIA